MRDRRAAASARIATILAVAVVLQGCGQDQSRSSAHQTPMVMANGNPPMTDADADFLRRQVLPCWNIDPRIPNPEKYSVVVRASIGSDGRVTRTELEDPSRPDDPNYRAVADSAIRAFLNPSCQPLRFPSGKYWPQVDFVFDLEKAINGGY